MLKLLLCYKEVVLDLFELVKGLFQLVLGEIDGGIDVKKVKCVLVCLGCVYYDFVVYCCEVKVNDVVIIWIEQLYLFVYKQFEVEMKKYENVIEVVWVQDELQNQGFWFYVEYYLKEGMKEGQKLVYSGCLVLVLLVVGYYVKYYEQQKVLIEGVFGCLKSVLIVK